MLFRATIFFGILAGAARAEYRLYQYLIKPRQIESIGLTPPPYQTISSLDPISYQSYHGGRSVQEINLLRSWMCVGHTGGREPCPSPLDSLPPMTREPIPQEVPPVNIPDLAPVGPS